MKDRLSWLVLCVAFVLLIGAGCSGIAPSQVAPAQAENSDKNGKDLYKYPEHDIDHNKMD